MEHGEGPETLGTPFFFFGGASQPSYKDEQNLIFHLQGGFPFTQTHKIQYLQIPVAYQHVCLVFPCRQDSSRAEESIAFLLFKLGPTRGLILSGEDPMHMIYAFITYIFTCAGPGSSLKRKEMSCFKVGGPIHQTRKKGGSLPLHCTC